MAKIIILALLLIQDKIIQYMHRLIRPCVIVVYDIGVKQVFETKYPEWRSIPNQICVLQPFKCRLNHFKLAVGKTNLKII